MENIYDVHLKLQAEHIDLLKKYIELVAKYKKLQEQISSNPVTI